MEGSIELSPDGLMGKINEYLRAKPKGLRVSIEANGGISYELSVNSNMDQKGPLNPPIMPDVFLDRLKPKIPPDYTCGIVQYDPPYHQGVRMGHIFINKIPEPKGETRVD